MSNAWFCSQWTILGSGRSSDKSVITSWQKQADFHLKISWYFMDSAMARKNTSTISQMLHHTFVSADHRAWFQANVTCLLSWIKVFLLKCLPNSCWWLIVNLETLRPKSLTNCHPWDIVASLTILLPVHGERTHLCNLPGRVLHSSDWFTPHSYCPKNGYGDFLECIYFYSQSLIIWMSTNWWKTKGIWAVGHHMFPQVKQEGMDWRYNSKDVQYISKDLCTPNHHTYM